MNKTIKIDRFTARYEVTKLNLHESMPYAVVVLELEPDDNSKQYLRVEFSIPFRDTEHNRSIEDVQREVIETAKRSIDLEKFAQGYPL